MQSIDDLLIEIINSVNNFISSYRNDLTTEEYKEIKQKVLNLKNKKIETYEELKNIENQFLKYFARVWEKEMTEFEQFNGLDDFNFVVTCPTKKTNEYHKPSTTISASLITDKHMGTYNKTPYCIVCSVDETNILGVSEDDMHSVVTNDSDLNIKNSYFYINKLDETKQIYSKKYVMSLKTPIEIEKKLMLENTISNGNILINGEKSVYSDILLDGKKTNFLGVLLLRNGYEKEAEELAQKFNLKVIKLDLVNYYKKAGLDNSNSNTLKYDLHDVDTVKNIIKNLPSIQNQNSNLDIQKMINNVYIKSDDTEDYLYYDINNQKADIILKKDTRFIRIDFSIEPIECYIDDKKVTEEELEKILQENKSIKKRY